MNTNLVFDLSWILGNDGEWIINPYRSQRYVKIEMGEEDLRSAQIEKSIDTSVKEYWRYRAREIRLLVEKSFGAKCIHIRHFSIKDREFGFTYSMPFKSACVSIEDFPVNAEARIWRDGVRLFVKFTWKIH